MHNMESEHTIAIPVTEFIHDPVFRLLETEIRCSMCGNGCYCEGCSGRELIYRCLACQIQTADRLDFEPLFAADILHAAMMQHYEITCPYCHGRGHLVGGSLADGLFFVCEDRCHIHFVRTIRRF